MDLSLYDQISIFFTKDLITRFLKMIASYLPAILVPILGIFLPGIAMASLFIYIEKESVE
jgi:photosystem I reaction center subunit VIII